MLINLSFKISIPEQIKKCFFIEVQLIYNVLIFFLIQLSVSGTGGLPR